MTTPSGPATCRTCSAPLEPGAERCARCNSAVAPGKCPHCGATAGASPERELWLACDVCGGPRLPQVVEGKVGRAGLQAAEAARKGRAGWRAGAGFAGVFLPIALFAALIFGLLFHSVLAAAVPGFGALLLIAALVATLRTASGKTKVITEGVDAAWLAAATHVVRSAKAPLSAVDLAAAMRIDETRAEQLLARLSVEDLMRGEITAAGDLAYQPSRIAPPGPTAVRVPTDDAVAEEEAASAETALAPQPGAKR